MVDEVLAEDHVTAKHGAGKVVFGPAHGRVHHVAQANGRRHRRLESPQVHADEDGVLVHDCLLCSRRLQPADVSQAKACDYC